MAAVSIFDVPHMAAANRVRPPAHTYEAGVAVGDGRNEPLHAVDHHFHRVWRGFRAAFFPHLQTAGNHDDAIVGIGITPEFDVLVVWSRPVVDKPSAVPNDFLLPDEQKGGPQVPDTPNDDFVKLDAPSVALKRIMENKQYNIDGIQERDLIAGFSVGRVPSDPRAWWTETTNPRSENCSGLLDVWLAMKYDGEHVTLSIREVLMQAATAGPVAQPPHAKPMWLDSAYWFRRGKTSHSVGGRSDARSRGGGRAPPTRQSRRLQHRSPLVQDPPRADQRPIESNQLDPSHAESVVPIPGPLIVPALPSAPQAVPAMLVDQRAVQARRPAILATVVNRQDDPVTPVGPRTVSGTPTRRRGVAVMSPNDIADDLNAGVDVHGRVGTPGVALSNGGRGRRSATPSGKRQRRRAAPRSVDDLVSPQDDATPRRPGAGQRSLSEIMNSPADLNNRAQGVNIGPRQLGLTGSAVTSWRLPTVFERFVEDLRLGSDLKEAAVALAIQQSFGDEPDERIQDFPGSVVDAVPDVTDMQPLVTEALKWLSESNLSEPARVALEKWWSLARTEQWIHGRWARGPPPRDMLSVPRLRNAALVQFTHHYYNALASVEPPDRPFYGATKSPLWCQRLPRFNKRPMQQFHTSSFVAMATDGHGFDVFINGDSATSDTGQLKSTRVTTDLHQGADFQNEWLGLVPVQSAHTHEENTERMHWLMVGTRVSVWFSMNTKLTHRRNDEPINDTFSAGDFRISIPATGAAMLTVTSSAPQLPMTEVGRAVATRNALYWLSRYAHLVMTAYGSTGTLHVESDLFQPNQHVNWDNLTIDAPGLQFFHPNDAGRLRIRLCPYTFKTDRSTDVKTQHFCNLVVFAARALLQYTRTDMLLSPDATAFHQVIRDATARAWRLALLSQFAFVTGTMRLADMWNVWDPPSAVLDYLTKGPLNSIMGLKKIGTLSVYAQCSWPVKELVAEIPVANVRPRWHMLAYSLLCGGLGPELEELQGWTDTGLPTLMTFPDGQGTSVIVAGVLQLVRINLWALTKANEVHARAVNSTQRRASRARKRAPVADAAASAGPAAGNDQFDPVVDAAGADVGDPGAGPADPDASLRASQFRESVARELDGLGGSLLPGLEDSEYALQITELNNEQYYNPADANGWNGAVRDLGNGRQNGISEWWRRQDYQAADSPFHPLDLPPALAGAAQPLSPLAVPVDGVPSGQPAPVHAPAAMPNALDARIGDQAMAGALEVEEVAQASQGVGKPVVDARDKREAMADERSVGLAGWGDDGDEVFDSDDDGKGAAAEQDAAGQGNNERAAAAAPGNNRDAAAAPGGDERAAAAPGDNRNNAVDSGSDEEDPAESGSDSDDGPENDAPEGNNAVVARAAGPEMGAVAQPPQRPRQQDVPVDVLHVGGDVQPQRNDVAPVADRPNDGADDPDDDDGLAFFEREDIMRESRQAIADLEKRYGQAVQELEAKHATQMAEKELVFKRMLAGADTERRDRDARIAQINAEIFELREQAQKDAAQLNHQEDLLAQQMARLTVLRGIRDDEMKTFAAQREDLERKLQAVAAEQQQQRQPAGDAGAPEGKRFDAWNVDIVGAGPTNSIHITESGSLDDRVDTTHRLLEGGNGGTNHTRQQPITVNVGSEFPIVSTEQKVPVESAIVDGYVRGHPVANMDMTIDNQLHLNLLPTGAYRGGSVPTPSCVNSYQNRVEREWVEAFLHPQQQQFICIVDPDKWSDAERYALTVLVRLSYLVAVVACIEARTTNPFRDLELVFTKISSDVLDPVAEVTGRESIDIDAENCSLRTAMWGLLHSLREKDGAPSVGEALHGICARLQSDDDNEDPLFVIMRPSWPERQMGDTLTRVLWLMTNRDVTLDTVIDLRIDAHADCTRANERPERSIDKQAWRRLCTGGPHWGKFLLDGVLYNAIFRRGPDLPSVRGMPSLGVGMPVDYDNTKFEWNGVLGPVSRIWQAHSRMCAAVRIMDLTDAWGNIWNIPEQVVGILPLPSDIVAVASAFGWMRPDCPLDQVRDTMHQISTLIRNEGSKPFTEAAADFHDTDSSSGVLQEIESLHRSWPSAMRLTPSTWDKRLFHLHDEWATLQGRVMPRISPQQLRTDYVMYTCAAVTLLELARREWTDALSWKIYDTSLTEPVGAFRRDYIAGCAAHQVFRMQEILCRSSSDTVLQITLREMERNGGTTPATLNVVDMACLSMLATAVKANRSLSEQAMGCEAVRGVVYEIRERARTIWGKRESLVSESNMDYIETCIVRGRKPELLVAGLTVPIQRRVLHSYGVSGHSHARVGARFSVRHPTLMQNLTDLRPVIESLAAQSGFAYVCERMFLVIQLRAAEFINKPPLDEAGYAALRADIANAQDVFRDDAAPAVPRASAVSHPPSQPRAPGAQPPPPVARVVVAANRDVSGVHSDSDDDGSRALNLLARVGTVPKQAVAPAAGQQVAAPAARQPAVVSAKREQQAAAPAARQPAVVSAKRERREQSSDDDDTPADQRAHLALLRKAQVVANEQRAKLVPKQQARQGGAGPALDDSPKAREVAKANQAATVGKSRNKKNKQATVDKSRNAKNAAKRSARSHVKFDVGSGWPASDEALLARISVLEADTHEHRLHAMWYFVNRHVGLTYTPESVPPLTVASVAIDIMGDDTYNANVSSSIGNFFAPLLAPSTKKASLQFDDGVRLVNDITGISGFKDSTGAIVWLLPLLAVLDAAGMTDVIGSNLEDEEVTTVRYMLITAAQRLTEGYAGEETIGAHVDLFVFCYGMDQKWLDDESSFVNSLLEMCYNVDPVKELVSFNDGIDDVRSNMQVGDASNGRFSLMAFVPLFSKNDASGDSAKEVTLFDFADYTSPRNPWATDLVGESLSQQFLALRRSFTRCMRAVQLQRLFQDETQKEPFFTWASNQKRGQTDGRKRLDTADPAADAAVVQKPRAAAGAAAPRAVVAQKPRAAARIAPMGAAGAAAPRAVVAQKPKAAAPRAVVAQKPKAGDGSDIDTDEVQADVGPPGGLAEAVQLAKVRGL